MRDLTKKVVPIAAMVAIVAASGAGSLGAQNLVVNPGFESGNAGWNLSNNVCPVGDPTVAPAYTGAAEQPPYSLNPHGGSWVMWFGGNCPGYQDPNIFQTLITTPGQQYTLDFWVQSYWTNPGNNLPNTFLAQVNAGTMYSVASLASNPWMNVSATFTGTGSDILTFSGTNPNGGTELDDVSVTPTVPEPTSMVLLATGLLGMGGALRRFRRKQNA